MDTEARGEAAASGQPIAGPQPPALDIGGQRTRDLQKRRESRTAVEIDDELPVASQGQVMILVRDGCTGLIEIANPVLFT
jgi:hypothetical protein